MVPMHRGLEEKRGPCPIQCRGVWRHRNNLPVASENSRALELRKNLHGETSIGPHDRNVRRKDGVQKVVDHQRLVEEVPLGLWVCNGPNHANFVELDNRNVCGDDGLVPLQLLKDARGVQELKHDAVVGVQVLAHDTIGAHDVHPLVRVVQVHVLIAPGPGLWPALLVERRIYIGLRAAVVAAARRHEEAGHAVVAAYPGGRAEPSVRVCRHANFRSCVVRASRGISVLFVHGANARPLENSAAVYPRRKVRPAASRELVKVGPRRGDGRGE